MELGLYGLRSLSEMRAITGNESTPVGRLMDPVRVRVDMIDELVMRINMETIQYASRTMSHADLQNCLKSREISPTKERL